MRAFVKSLLVLSLLFALQVSATHAAEHHEHASLVHECAVCGGLAHLDDSAIDSATVCDYSPPGITHAGVKNFSRPVCPKLLPKARGPPLRI